MPHIVSAALLKATFSSEHYPTLLSGSETHDATLRFVAQLVRVTEDRDLIRGAAESGFPPGYDGDSLREIPRMVEDAFKKGFHQPPPKPRKGKVVDAEPSRSDQLMAALETESYTLFHNEDRGFVSRELFSGGQVNHLVRSIETKRWLRRIYFEQTSKALPDSVLTEVIDLLDARAVNEGEDEAVFRRVAPHGDEVLIDLCRDDGLVVRIGAGGWQLTYECPVRFQRPQRTKALPAPLAGRALKELRELLGLDKQSFLLCLAFLLTCLMPGGPYFCLLIEGEQGSGKSLLSKILKLIIDPSEVEKLRLPDNERDLSIQANAYYLLVFDNSSGMRFNISDALCTLSTGGSFGVRALYTDEDLHVITVMRPFILNGITGIATRPDLLERMIGIHLPGMPPESRKTEREVMSAFERLLPTVLGELYDYVACALLHQKTTEPPRGLRMADAAHWLQAAEPATGVVPGTFLRVLEDSQTNLMIERVSSHPVVMAILNKVKGTYSGTVGELFAFLQPDELYVRDRSFPKTAAHLSRELERLKPVIKKMGIEVIHRERTRAGRMIEITRDETVAPLGGPGTPGDPNAQPY